MGCKMSRLGIAILNRYRDISIFRLKPNQSDINIVSKLVARYLIILWYRPSLLCTLNKLDLSYCKEFCRRYTTCTGNMNHISNIYVKQILGSLIRRNMKSNLLSSILSHIIYPWRDINLINVIWKDFVFVWNDAWWGCYYPITNEWPNYLTAHSWVWHRLY